MPRIIPRGVTLVNNPKNKSSDWLGTPDKILAILLIVAVVHMVIITLFGWFNVWRLSPGDKESEKKEALHVMDNSENDAVNIPIQDEREKPAAEPSDVVQEENLQASGELPEDDGIIPELEEIDLHPLPEDTVKNVELKMKREAFETYTVVEGDNLLKISRKTGTSVSELRMANNIENDIIKIGQVLLLPANLEDSGVSLAETSDIAETQQPESHILKLSSTSSQYEIYTVKKNDTLSKIARLFLTSADVLAKINSIKDPDNLKVGMTIKVPSK
ncbi:MAG: LysM peptidoglycan-binding domain-containing protein [Victivallales bacterium]